MLAFSLFFVFGDGCVVWLPTVMILNAQPSIPWIVGLHFGAPNSRSHLHTVGPNLGII